MKKMFFVSLLLTAAIAAQAQLKIAPKMQKGAVKTYITVSNSRFIYNKTGNAIDTNTADILLDNVEFIPNVNKE